LSAPPGPLAAIRGGVPTSKGGREGRKGEGRHARGREGGKGRGGREGEEREGSPCMRSHK